MDLGTERPDATHSPEIRDKRIIELAFAADKEALRGFTQKTGTTAEAVRKRARRLGLTKAVVRSCRRAGTRPAMRACLRCEDRFLSHGRHNRLCRKCARRRW